MYSGYKIGLRGQTFENHLQPAPTVKMMHICDVLQPIYIPIIVPIIFMKEPCGQVFGVKSNEYMPKTQSCRKRLKWWKFKQLPENDCFFDSRIKIVATKDPQVKVGVHQNHLQYGFLSFLLLLHKKSHSMSVIVVNRCLRWSNMSTAYCFMS